MPGSASAPTQNGFDLEDSLPNLDAFGIAVRERTEFLTLGAAKTNYLLARFFNVFKLSNSAVIAISSLILRPLEWIFSKKSKSFTEDYILLEKVHL
jgi:hypothetical protein